MNEDALIMYQNEMSNDLLARYLVDFAFNLTIMARNTYVAGSDEVDRPTALRGIVEISHRVLGRALHVINNAERISTDVFVNALYGLAANYGCVFELENAVVFSFENANTK